MKKTTGVVLGILLSLGIPLNSVSLAADITDYKRKYISFFQEQENKQESTLTSLIVEGISLSLPRFDYKHLGKKAEGIKLLDFLSQVKEYQKKNAGTMASEKEKKDVKFGTQVVSWTDTKSIMESAYVFSPKLDYSETKVGGAYQKKDSDGKVISDAVDVTSTLKCDLEIYKLTGDTPVLYSTVKGDWDLKKQILIFSGEVKNPSENSQVSNALKSNPSSYFYDIALKEITDEVTSIKKKDVPIEGLGELIKNAKQLDDFVLMAQVMEGSDWGTTVLGFGDKEDVKTLGVNLDNSFKVFEDKDGQLSEVGFMKIREFSDKQAKAQPIIAGREFELGDIAKEYPKMGYNIGLKLGTQNFKVGTQESSFLPSATVDFEYTLAPKLGISELYATGSIGIGLPLLLGVWNAGAEIGVKKKFFLRQFIFDVGLRGGGMKGFVIGDTSGNTIETPFIYGGTGSVGISYQFTPDLIIGLDAGYRFYPNPVISSQGPVFNLFSTYSM